MKKAVKKLIKATSKAKRLAKAKAKQTSGVTRKVGYLYFIFQNYHYPSFPLTERKQVEGKAADIVEVMERHNRLIDSEDESGAAKVEKRIDSMLKDLNAWINTTLDKIELSERKERSAKASALSKATLAKMKADKAEKTTPKAAKPAKRTKKALKKAVSKGKKTVKATKPVKKAA
jgi:spore cortex formation protein SpoVR/YcgB (stage V sporulation)